jgi:hypothetical protein
MEVDGLVTALERIEHAARDFMRLPRDPGHDPEAPNALLRVLTECGRALHQPYALDAGLDDVRGLASRHCAALQGNLEALQRGDVGDGGNILPAAVLEEVRQLHMTISELLPTLVKIADRE